LVRQKTVEQQRNDKRCSFASGAEKSGSALKEKHVVNTGFTVVKRNIYLESVDQFLNLIAIATLFLIGAHAADFAARCAGTLATVQSKCSVGASASRIAG
jgi:hypothetical protein